MIYYPELDTVFYDYWTKRGVITVHTYPFPEKEALDLVPDTSVFRLLFDETYTEDTYVYKMAERSKASFSAPLSTRLYSTNKISAIYATDSTGTENPLGFEAEDLLMLDLLHAYRVSGSDATAGMALVSYPALAKPLPKLIYNYLDLLLNANYYSCEDGTLLSDSGTILETLFEAYVVNESHRYIQTMDGVVGTDLQAPALPIQQVYQLDQTPSPGTRVVLFKNGQVAARIDVDTNTLVVDGATANQGDAFTIQYTQEPYVGLEP